MFVCKNCGKAYQSQTNFCPACGGAVVETYSASQSSYGAQPVEAQQQSAPTSAPAYENAPSAPTYSEPSTPTYSEPTPPYGVPTPPPAYSYSAHEPAVSGGAKAKGIISLVMGIWTIISSLISFGLLGGLSELADSYYRSRSAVADMAAFVIGWCVVNLGISIAGLILGSSARNNGFTSGVSMTGKVLSLISLIIHAIIIIATIGITA